MTFIGDLKPATEYEYVVVVSDVSYGVSLNDIDDDMRVDGTAMTKDHDFNIDVSTIKKQDGWSGMVVKVQADTNSGIENMKAVLTLNNGDIKEVMLSKDKDYTETVTFDNLFTGKNYRVTSAELKVMETITGKCDYVTVASLNSERNNGKNMVAKK